MPIPSERERERRSPASNLTFSTEACAEGFHTNRKPSAIFVCLSL